MRLPAASLRHHFAEIVAGPCSPALCGARNVKDRLESLDGLMVERGILLKQAVTEFEKKFIRRVLEKLNGNQSRAAKILGMHRNTLSRKIGEYKLDHVGRKHR